MEKIDIKSLSKEELKELLSEMGESAFRANQIFDWLHKARVESFDEMTNISKNLRQLLEQKCYIANVKIVRKLCSKIDGTVKYLFELGDGQSIETVLMKYNYGYSICISTQVGCRMGCSFCASGLFGLTRNLTPSEMLSQIYAAQNDKNVRVSHLVLMGIGEPMDNFDNVIKFLSLITHKDGNNLSMRNISVSTSGVVSGINKLAEYNFPLTLSISLHAPNDQIRSKIMPINKKWSVKELISACKSYILVTNRRVSFEYAIIEGVNDSDEAAKELATLLKGMLCHVNLIPANPVKENSFQKPNIKKIKHFCELLNSLGINTTIRRTLGADINASCGQLRQQNTK